GRTRILSPSRDAGARPRAPPPPPAPRARVSGARRSARPRQGATHATERAGARWERIPAPRTRRASARPAPGHRIGAPRRDDRVTARAAVGPVRLPPTHARSRAEARAPPATRARAV